MRTVSYIINVLNTKRKVAACMCNEKAEEGGGMGNIAACNAGNEMSV